MQNDQDHSENSISSGELLVQRAKDGSLSGLGDLLETFRPLLFRMATAKIDSGLRRRMSESDIVQQTMLTASRSMCDFRGTTEIEFRNWLLRIFETRLADGFRRHRIAERRRTSHELGAWPSDVADSHDSASTVLQAQEDSQQLLAAILELLPEEREIVLLRYSEQKGFEAIAAQLGIPLTTVWRRWSQAVDKLKVRLTLRDEDV